MRSQGKYLSSDQLDTANKKFIDINSQLDINSLEENVVFRREIHQKGTERIRRITRKSTYLNCE